MKSDQALSPPGGEEEKLVLRNTLQRCHLFPLEGVLPPPSHTSFSCPFFHLTPGQVDILSMPLETWI